MNKNNNTKRVTKKTVTKTSAKPIKKINKKELQKIQKKNKRQKKFFKICTFLIVSFIAVWLFISSSLFNIKNIEVKNNKNISIEKILELSKLHTTENIFNLSKKEISNNIKQDAYIGTVLITKILPNNIEIYIEERQAAFLIENSDKFIYVDNQGYVLEIADLKLELPILTGISTKKEDLNPCNRLNNEDLEKLNTAIIIINETKNNEIYTLVTSIDITNKKNYIINFGSKDKIAIIGDNTNLITKIMYVKEILNKTEGKKGEIFVNMNLNSEKADPYFKERIEVT